MRGLINVFFSVTCFRTFFADPLPYFFRGPLTFFKLVGGIGGPGGIKMVSARTQSISLEPRLSAEWGGGGGGGVGGSRTSF